MSKPKKHRQHRMSSRSLANLKLPVKPGDPPRNPAGHNGNKRPFSDLYLATSQDVNPESIRRKLNEIADAAVFPPGITWAAAGSRALHFESAKGNVTASRELADRVEGKAPQRLEITGPIRKDVRITVRFEARKRPQE